MNVNSQAASPNLTYEQQCNGAPASAAGIYLVGGRHTGLRFPAPINITLYVDPALMVALPAVSDTWGFARTPLPIPAGLGLGSLAAQYVWIGGCATVTASDSLRF